MIRISLCMIVKDEEQTLGRVLGQMRDVADEIIVVDTGSTDRTKEIAAEYNARIFEYPWRDDFAAARNFACEKARMDYWMWLDADDVLTDENRAKLLDLKKTLNPDADVVMMRYLAGFDEDGRAGFSYYRERLLRNGRGFVWEGRVHEAVTPSGKIVYSDICVEHRKVKACDADRNLKIYEKMLAEGELLEARHRFYYGRELFYHARFAEAAENFERFLEMPDGWRENKIDACMQAALCYEKLGETGKRFASLLRSFEYDVPRAEICCDIGRLFMERAEYATAIYWYEQALAAPDRSREGGFYQRDYYEYIPLMQLCVCCDRLGEYYRAWQYHLRAEDARPDAAAVAYNREYFARLFSQG